MLGVTLVVADRTASLTAGTNVCWTATWEQPDGERTRVTQCTGVSATRVFDLAAGVVTDCDTPGVHVMPTASDHVSTTHPVQGTVLWVGPPTTRTLYVRCDSPIGDITGTPVTG